MKKRVVITGMGAVTPLGIGLDTFWSALIAGKSGVRKIERFDASNLSTQIAAEVVGFDPTAYIDKKEARRMDRYTQFAVVASGMALQDAGLDLDKEDKERIGVIIGSGVGGIETLEAQAKVLVEKGPSRVSPFFVPMMIANMAAGQTAITYGLRGPNITTVTACASSTNAVGDAFKLLQRGDADVMVTGGTEAPVVELAMAGFCSLKALSTRNDDPVRASRPFDKERDGFVIGEGGAILILETLEHAQARGARIYAEIVGYGTSCDAYHITAPDPEGAGVSRSMQIAINDAGLNPVDVDYINAHGTSTPMNDKLETIGIKKVFGEHAHKVAISSTKSMTGHLLGAAGGLEAIVCALTIQKGIVPPTVNYENPDPDCDLEYVPNKARQAQVRVALSNSLAFGGHNATIVLKKFE